MPIDKSLLEGLKARREEALIGGGIDRIEKRHEKGLLSAREREVLQLLSEGKSTREIGDKLNVSAKTVETHRQHLMDKLNMHTVAELTKYAIREGLTPLE